MKEFIARCEKIYGFIYVFIYLAKFCSFHVPSTLAPWEIFGTLNVQFKELYSAIVHLEGTR